MTRWNDRKHRHGLARRGLISLPPLGMFLLPVSVWSLPEASVMIWALSAILAAAGMIVMTAATATAARRGLAWLRVMPMLSDRWLRGRPRGLSAAHFAIDGDEPH